MNDLLARLHARSKREGECLVWTGHRLPRGYGLLSVKTETWMGKRYAHRIAWEIANGRPVPEGRMVCHRCDNPSCIEPAHLFLGTHKENMADMKSKGRGHWNGIVRKGAAHPNAILTPAQVQEIRRMYRDCTVTHSRLAALFEVSTGTITAILNGRRWSDLPGLLTPEELRAAARRVKATANRRRAVEVTVQ